MIKDHDHLRSMESKRKIIRKQTFQPLEASIRGRDLMYSHKNSQSRKGLERRSSMPQFSE